MSHCRACSGSYFKDLFEPTIRGLEGPYRSDTGPKGALDRLLTRLNANEPPLELRRILKLVYNVVTKTLGDRAIEPVIRLFIGDLLAGTLKQVGATAQNLGYITSQGKRHVSSMGSVLMKLSQHQQFPADSEHYNLNSWIQLKHKLVNQILIRFLMVDEPVIPPWSSGCTAKGSSESHRILLEFLVSQRSKIDHVYADMEWSSPTKHAGRLPALWSCLEHWAYGWSAAAGQSMQAIAPYSQEILNFQHAGHPHQHTPHSGGSDLGNIVTPDITSQRASDASVRHEGGIPNGGTPSRWPSLFQGAFVASTTKVI